MMCLHKLHIKIFFWIITRLGEKTFLLNACFMTNNLSKLFFGFICSYDFCIVYTLGRFKKKFFS